jgi:hypothetical protein
MPERSTGIELANGGLVVFPTRDGACSSASALQPRSSSTVNLVGSLSISFAQFWQSQMAFSTEPS